MNVLFALRYLLLCTLLCLGLGAPVHAAPLTRQGLQITLTTGGYEFEAPASESAGTTFAAVVQLTNLSRSGLAFSFPDPASAALHFKFRILDSAGTELWESDSDLVSAQVTTPATLARKSAWRRTAQIPLKINGTALPLGVYTLEAALAGTPTVKATSLFSVAPLGSVGDTGIKGQVGVYEADAAVQPSVITLSRFVGIPARLEIKEIRLSNARYDHPAFQWTGSTDAHGFYKVATPAGRFTVHAEDARLMTAAQTSTPSPLTISLPRGGVSSGTAEVLVRRGNFTEQSFRLGFRSSNPLPAVDTGIKGHVVRNALLTQAVAGGTAGATEPVVGASVVISSYHAGPILFSAPAGLLIRPPSFPVTSWLGVTDEEGRFQANLLPGQYRVKVYHIGSGANSTLLASSFAQVTAGAFTDVELHETVLANPSIEGRLIYSLDSLKIKNRTAAELVIEASGMVNSGGWSNPRLVARPSTNPAVLEFDFLADPPTGPATQALAGTTATVTIRNPEAVRTVRVRTSTNQQDLAIAP